MPLWLNKGENGTTIAYLRKVGTICSYSNSTANCDMYGGLYIWQEMMDGTNQAGAQGICPHGWHIPTDNDWKILEGNVDSQYGVGDPIWNLEGGRGLDVGTHLRSTTGWQNNGDDASGFSSLPGGRHQFDSFDDLGTDAYFWSSTIYSYSNQT